MQLRRSMSSTKKSSSIRAMANKRGLQRVLGPFPVAFADLQLRKEVFDGTIQPPMMRFYYPCRGGRQKTCSIGTRRWLPGVAYAYGYMSNMMRPSTAMRRILVWILACIVYILMWPGSALAALVANPILPEEDDNHKGRFPVVVFSHGLWACRTTYSAFCCDLASYGYIVVAPEHLDGSANMACYLDNNGKRKWLYHKYADAELHDISLEERSQQLKQRVKEIGMVFDTLQRLNSGLLTHSSNLVTGKVSLDVNMLHGRIDINRIALAGHSFGGATAVVASGSDKRIKCCLGLDVWWEPVEKLDYLKVSGKVPVLLLNTEKFDWKALREARLIFLNARAKATSDDGQPLITELATIKGTDHQDQSDLPLLLPGISKKLRLSGELDINLAKNINSRACLYFLQKHLLDPGKRFPLAIETVESDSRYLVYAAI